MTLLLAGSLSGAPAFADGGPIPQEVVAEGAPAAMKTAFNYFRGGQVSYSKFMEFADNGNVRGVVLHEGG